MRANRMAEPFIDQRILELLHGVPQKAKILDIACGQGYVSETLFAKGYQNLHSADINSANFKLNRQRFHFKKVDANHPLPYRSGSFDVVISSETIEHLENPLQFLREVYRILKPKGVFILTTPSVENIISRFYFFATGRLSFHTLNDYRLSGHITVLPQWLIEQFTQDLHFKIVKKTFSSFYIPILKFRLPHAIFRRRLFGWIVIYQFQK